MIIQKTTGLKGTITIPGDKSISHRAVMFGSISKGTTETVSYTHLDVYKRQPSMVFLHHPFQIPDH